MFLFVTPNTLFLLLAPSKETITWLSVLLRKHLGNYSFGWFIKHPETRSPAFSKGSILLIRF